MWICRQIDLCQKSVTPIVLELEVLTKGEVNMAVGISGIENCLAIVTCAPALLAKSIMTSQLHFTETVITFLYASAGTMSTAIAWYSDVNSTHQRVRPRLLLIETAHWPKRTDVRRNEARDVPMSSKSISLTPSAPMPSSTVLPV